MKVRIFLEKENAHKSMEVQKGQTIEYLLKKLHINPQTVIVSRNGDIVPEQEMLQEKDSIRIMRFK